MAAAALAAVTAIEQVFRREDHVGTVPVEVNAFDELRRVSHLSDRVHYFDRIFSVHCDTVAQRDKLAGDSRYTLAGNDDAD